MHCRVRYLLNFDLKIYSGKVCSVYDVHENSSFVLYVTEFPYHMYRKNAIETAPGRPHFIIFPYFIYSNNLPLEVSNRHDSQYDKYFTKLS